MEYFDIVLTLARIAFNADGPRGRQQIERLRDNLQSTDPDQASKLNRLLSREGRRHTMAPLAMEEMRATAQAARRFLPGEPLSTSTPLPTDRETSTPLGRVIFPDIKPADPPVLNAPLAAAISDLIAEWQRSEELARLNVRPNTRCLIYGRPGVGKTKLARYLANQLGLPCLEVRLDGLMSSFLGTTARNIGALFDFANRYRCVLFLDEFDAIAKARDDAQEIGEIKRVVNTLLQSLDARQGLGVTLAATNHEHLLDSAVWRRFDSRIEIQVPDAEARKLLLQEFLVPIQATAEEMSLLVWASEGMSGADIEILIGAGKRYLVIHGSSDLNKNGQASAPALDRSRREPRILKGLRHQAMLNARLFMSDRVALITGPINDLDQALDGVGFTQHERGIVLGLSQSGISRRRKRSDDSDLYKEANAHA